MFSDVKTLLQDIKDGKMIIIMDDPGRENEGDFIMAAECITPEAINFMAKHGRGLVCMPLSAKKAQDLALNLMVPKSKLDKLGTQFTNSIEAAEGVSTGISAHDRSRTIQAAIAPSANSSSISQPGHVFPIIAQDGGVLTRAGHTEAACDYARLAGFEPAGVIVEILNEDGTMARQDDLFKIAKKFDLKIGTIADLIKYRMQHEQTVECVNQQNIATKFGEFKVKWFKDLLDNKMHCVLQQGDITTNPEPLPVRVYDPDPLIDIFNIQKDYQSCELADAMQYINNNNYGVIIILDRDNSGQIMCSRMSSLGKDGKLLSANSIRVDGNFKYIGAGSRILRALGASELKVLGAPLHYTALEGFGLKIVSYINLAEANLNTEAVS